ncbi:AMP-binding protein [Pararobbsia silviterrae]|uniref:Long-chain fatty acid--CoA ligase n=1 Tax=Pararobbsia silviterrae TaxID=1792498 RepID=A0A494YFQ3_9BURK|nr:AMP-binding protein [Pararobbsia silviterrae]RKP58867.1 long-chain fatty acid--CoA ligase [Pararobbsia silviterrae]
MTHAEPATLPAWLAEQARRRAPAPAIRSKRLGSWHALRWDDVAARTRALAAGLARRGFRQGDTLLLAAPPSERAVLLSLAAQWLGGVAVPIDTALGDAALRHAIEHLSARLAFADDDATLDRLLPLGVQIIDGNPRGLRDHPDPAVVGLASLQKPHAGDAEHDPLLPGEPLARADDTAFLFVDALGDGTLVTQHLTHASLIHDGRAVVAREALDAREEAFATRAFAASAQARYLIAPWLIAGFSLHFPEALSTRDADRREIAPTLVAGTRETYARVAALVHERLPASGWRRALVNAALGGTGGPVTRRLARWGVARPLREVIGFARTRVALVAGAPLDERTSALFAALDVDVHAWPDASDWRQVAPRSVGPRSVGPRSVGPRPVPHHAGTAHPRETAVAQHAPAHRDRDDRHIEYGRVPS